MSFRSRVLALALIVAAGCFSAALLHVLTQWELVHGSGADPFGGYAHVLVLPLLCVGTIGSVLVTFLRAVSSRDEFGRRASLAAVEAVTEQPFILKSASIALSAFGSFALCEYIEQLISFRHFEQALPVNFWFVLQLVLIAAFVTLLLNALLLVCFRTVDAFAALLSFHSRRMPSCVSTTFLRSHDVHQPIVDVLACSFGRRGPPHRLRSF